jgi:hypothetical protein
MHKLPVFTGSSPTITQHARGVHRLLLATAVAATLATSTAAADPAPRLRSSAKRHLRMTAELATLFVAGSLWYWRDGGDTNDHDWQLPNDTRALGAKMTQHGWRFDNNAFYVNAIYHPGWGSVMHAFARKNGYNLGETFLITTLASATWEVVAEWREYASINDLMITSPAGVPIGEVAHQMLSHMGATRLELSTGVGVENGASLVALAVNGSLDRIPARGSGTVGTGRRVSFGLELQSDTEGLRAIDGATRTILGGHYRNRGKRQLVSAITAAFEYRNRIDRNERDWDQVARVAVGPSLDYRTRLAGITFEVGTDAYVGFGMLKSQAFARWRSEHPTEAVRGVLGHTDRPYYYAANASVDPRIRLTRGRYLAGARLSGNVFGSIDGADRDGDLPPLGLADTDLRGQAWLGYRGGGMAFLLDGRLHDRRGRANDVVDATADQTIMLSVGYGL